MHKSEHYRKMRDQFSIRIPTYETAAKWMLDPRLIEAHLDAIGRPEGTAKRCLDLCCGTGIVGRSLLPLGWSVMGVDVTPEMVNAAREHYPVEVGSVESMPFEDASFDLAVIRQAYMLLDGPKALGEIRRILAPAGRFVLLQSVPFSADDAPVYEKVQWARHINMLRYYDAEALAREIEEGGFTVENESFLSVRESVDHWLNSAPELSVELRNKIRGLIQDSPEEYRRARNVQEKNGELFENWNWIVISARKREK